MDKHSDVVVDEKTSPVKKFGTAKLQIAPETSGFSGKVARLSISEDADTSLNIIKGLKHSKTGQESSADKRRRSSSSQLHIGSEKKLVDEKAVNGITSGSKSGSSKKAKKEEKKDVKKEHQIEVHTQTVKKRHDKSSSRRKKLRDLNSSGQISVERLGPRTSNIVDLREPIISCLCRTILNGCNLKIKNVQSVHKIIVIFLPGLKSEDLGLPSGTSFEEAGPFEVEKSKLFDSASLEQNPKAFPISAPGSNNSLYPAYNSFINRRLSKNERKARFQQLSSRKITINDLLLSLNDLIEHDYPIHPGLLDESSRPVKTEVGSYIDTRRFDHEGSHIFSLDCEMCLSSEGYVLTRVSVVNFDGNVVYDQLVKPDVPITDYLTKYSGITEEKLEHVTTTLQDVQNDILNIISEDDVLIGHSLENDLNALQIRHPKIVDTAIIYEHRAGPPFRPSLRNLASTYLSYDIQTGAEGGHNPIEDAKACMDLVKLKIVNGLSFGVSVTTENIFEKLSSAGVKCLKLDNDTIRRDRKEPVNDVLDFDAQIFESLVDNIDDYKFSVARFKGLALSRGYSYGISMRSRKDKEAAPSEMKSLEVLSHGLTNLYEKSPPGTMITVLSGNGDTRPYSKILAELESIDKDQRTEARRERSTELGEAVSRARDSVAVYFFKQDMLNN